MKLKKKNDQAKESSQEGSSNPLETGELSDQASLDSELNTVERSPKALEALRCFYDRLPLTEADQKELFINRGLTYVTTEALGFRSNLRSNEGILREMERFFSVEVLVESGLWKAGSIGEGPKPNPQFYGMSIVEKRDESGKKIRENGKPVCEPVWNNPILIPYFNEAGQLIHLRPHKGMMAGKTPRLYVPRVKDRPVIPHSNGYSKFAVITEGEFKAAALWQVLGEAAEVAALPGITMAKPLIGDVEDWLESIEVRQVIVAYDNENKSDENLPGYQREKQRRFDTHVWARYLARQLCGQGFDGKVSVLPDAWRDEKGKADWDGALAALEKSKNMRDGTAMEWDKVRNSINSEVLAVIQSAISVRSRFIKHFDEETEQIIRKQLERISYEPCLPTGGEEEQSLSRRLHRFAGLLKKKEWVCLRLAHFLTSLAQAYQATDGRYYKMKPLTDERLKQWEELREEGRKRGDDDVKRVCDLVLHGRKSLKEGMRGHIPVTVSDFYLKSHYVLHRADGNRRRVVSIYNVHGAVGSMVEMPSEDFGSPVKFRDWLHKNITGAAWDGGQAELTALHEDMARALAFKDVREVPVRGRHAKTGIWFFEDVAFSDDGEFLPDKTGIFWLKDDNGVTAYTFGRDKDGRPRDREDDVFRQGVPRMHPETKDTNKELRTLFIEVVSKLKESLGGMEAYIALGWVFAIAAAPEIYREWSCFPGLWVHGEQSEGKSSLVRWLIRIWGFLKEKGLPLPADEQRTTVTLPALSGALGQYAELPLWLDEYQTGTASWVRAILKNSYDRAEGAKKDFGNTPREFLASVIVSGVATSSEPQTRSRFAHVQVSSKNRKANHYDWFQENSREFYRLGRFLLRNRKAFVESALQAMSKWMKSNALQGINDRARMVHAVAYAGFHAAHEVFNVPADELKGYWDWLVDHCKQSAADVQESVSVDLFWREFLTGYSAGAFGHTPISELRKLIHVVEDTTAESPVSEHQTKAGAERQHSAWKSYLFYFRVAPILNFLRIHKRHGGENLGISQRDLQSQMKMRAYWVPSHDPSGHRQRFNNEGTLYCWCIKVDLHPMGLVRISDSDFDGHLKSSNSVSWADPRKGELFTIIDALLAKRGEENE